MQPCNGLQIYYSCLHVALSVCLSVYIPKCFVMSVQVFICPSDSLLCLAVCLPFSLTICLSVSESMSLLYIHTHTLVSLLVCLSSVYQTDLLLSVRSSGASGDRRGCRLSGLMSLTCCDSAHNPVLSSSQSRSARQPSLRAASECSEKRPQRRLQHGSGENHLPIYMSLLYHECWLPLWQRRVVTYTLTQLC